jgi:predicted HD phosphohydrolase
MSERAQWTLRDLAQLEAVLEAMTTSPSDEAEGLSELDHGLQCAAELAIAAPEDEALQIAGLVHDIGHGRSDIADHAIAGEALLREVLGERIAAIVGLHVAAKRYLVATDQGYFARLSPTSVLSLAVQGGAFTPAEATAFEARPYWREAVMLRRADEAAKVLGRKVPGLEHCRAALRRVAALAN